jgi:hypothetical protein
MLNQGVVGAFIIVRSLSNIHVTETCQSIPLRCKLKKLKVIYSVLILRLHVRCLLYHLDLKKKTEPSPFFFCMYSIFIYFLYIYINKGGPPLVYFDWNMITQGAWNGIESIALFGFAALAMEFAFQQKWISKFD